MIMVYAINTNSCIKYISQIKMIVITEKNVFPKMELFYGSDADHPLSLIITVLPR